MGNIVEKISSEIELVERSISELNFAVEKNRHSSVEVAGMGVFLLNVYSGIENILKQIFKDQKVPLPDSDRWHKDLLDTASAKSIISSDTSTKLIEYLTFRHFFIHNYGLKLSEERVLELATSIANVWEDVLADIRKIYSI